MKFTEAKFKSAFIEMMEKQDCPHHLRVTIFRKPPMVMTFKMSSFFHNKLDK